MVHRLAQPDQPLHGAGLAPLTASLRYRCACTGGEVLTIQVVMPDDLNEESFAWTMKAMWRDMQTEIRQHMQPQGDD